MEISFRSETATDAEVVEVWIRFSFDATASPRRASDDGDQGSQFLVLVMVSKVLNVPVHTHEISPTIKGKAVMVEGSFLP